MIEDYKSQPMTTEEEAAWDEHERLLSMGHDRAAYMDHKAHEMNVAICNAIATQPPWED